uniref:Transmembrane domain-containing protein n=1 Tax=Spironucleus salmonicida TaxID=348837 RepID=V6LUU3_9EUKA|eukprot:EST47476.1 Transmembrane domain-containing protein [Spironucleus salmonicida]
MYLLSLYIILVIGSQITISIYLFGTFSISIAQQKHPLLLLNYAYLDNNDVVNVNITIFVVIISLIFIIQCSVFYLTTKIFSNYQFY